MAAKSKKNDTQTAKKVRKPYPSHDERIKAADQKIARLEALIADRSDLIAKTEKILEERKAALAKNEEVLNKVRAKKERLIATAQKQASGEKIKLTPEERAEKRKASLARAREVKRAAKAKYDTLIQTLEERGVSVEEVLDQMKK